MNHKQMELKNPKGVTIIDHKIRYLLKLSLEEYTIALCIYHYNKKYASGGITYRRYFSDTGIEPAIVDNVITSLKSKLILSWDSKKNRIQTTSFWNNNFDEDAKFNQLWEIHPKGTKADAKANFALTIKLVPFNALLEKLQEYVQSNDEVKYLKDLSGWLNPKKRRWENQLEFTKKIDNKHDNNIPSTLFK